jgi:2-polyprenyl-3-methyl-5-hydroxy-6-metoxy-1,4-benzoquinol methylase
MTSKIEIERLSEQAKIAIASEFASLPPKTLERILESKSALDLGCGDGSFIKYLHEHSPGIALTGVDISKSLAQFSQTACGKYANIINQDATDFLMTSGSEDYDLISMRYFIGHLPADQYSKIFAACRMRLKPNGILYIASVDPTYTRFHPRIPTFELAWFQKELHKKRSGGHWQAPPFIGENLATADFCSTQTFTRFFTTENLEPNKFASVIGRQLLWGSDPSWDSVMRQAAKELDEWALNRSGFAQTMIVIHIAEKK